MGPIGVVINTNESPRITEQKLYATVEVKLKSAGIEVVSRAKGSLNTPYLVVNVGTVVDLCRNIRVIGCCRQEVFNDSNRTLYLDLGKENMFAYTILSGESKKFL